MQEATNNLKEEIDKRKVEIERLEHEISLETDNQPVKLKSLYDNFN